MTIQQQLSLLADDFDRSAGHFPNFKKPVEVTPDKGPMIRPYALGRFDESGNVRPPWLEYANAIERFQELAKRLEPLLIESGATLIDGVDSTVEGRILFWSLGNQFPPASRNAILLGGNAFWLVAVAIRQFGTNSADFGSLIAELTASDWKILKALRACYPEPKTQEQLSQHASTGLSVRTLSPRLAFLRERRVVERPTDKSGDRLTTSGLEWLAKTCPE